MEKPLYKPAKLYDCNGDVSPGREWYFHFYILKEDGSYKRCLERFDINRKRGSNDTETRKLRYAYAKIVLPQLNEWLESGRYAREKAATQPEFMPVERAVRYAMELKQAKGLRKRSLQTYQNAADRYVEYLHHSCTDKMGIAELNRKHIQFYADWLAMSRNICNLSKNKYITHLRAIMAELVDRELIKVNPCSNMGKLREDMGEKNIPLSADELLKLKMELPGRHPRLWLFSLLIYYGYMRSQEICQLKAGMIDFQNGFICHAARHRYPKHRCYYRYGDRNGCHKKVCLAT